MKSVAFVHTDFRLSWPGRLAAARQFLAARGIHCHVIEIAGLGSPYAFALKERHESTGRSDHGTGGNGQKGYWKSLFPERAMETISPTEASRAVWRALELLQPDVVFAGAIAFPSGATGVRWSRERSRRVVIMDDARLADVPRSRTVNWVKGRIFANVDALLVPAPSHVPDYAFWGVPEERLFFGVNAVDNAAFARSASAVVARADRERAELVLPQRFLLGIGRQVIKKNWESLLRAWAGVSREGSASGLQLLLVGDGPERTRLTALAHELALTGVQFRDFVAPGETPRYYALASGLVLPSLEGETWGLVVNEAMACGLPVVVSRQCGCASTLVKPRRNGWLFDAHRPDELAAVLTEFADCSEARLQAMGAASREIIGHWGFDRFCDAVWQAIQCVKRSSPRRGGWLDGLLLRLWKGRYRPT